MRRSSIRSSRSLTAALTAISIMFSTLLVSCSDPSTESQGTLRIGNGAEPRSLDPHQAVSLAEGHVVTALFEGLVMQPEEGDAGVAPAVAREWTANEDHTLFTFQLRPEARWSDGVGINAATFIASFERILNPTLGSQNAELLYDIKNARAYNLGEISDFSQVGLSSISEYELVISLAQPTPYFLQKLKHWAWYPVPVHAITENGGLHDVSNPWSSENGFVSNGPYTLANWQRNQRITVSKSETYWDAETVAVERIEFYPFENTQAEYRAFLANQLDVTEEIASEMKDADLPGARSDPLLATSYLLLNTESKALSNPRARRALSQAIQRQRLIKAIVRSGFPASRFTPAAMPRYPLLETDAPEDVSLSESEVAEINANGPLVMVVSNRDVFIALAEAIQDMWRRTLGVEIRIQNMEFKSFLTRLDEGDFDVSYIAWYGDYLDPFTFLDIWRSDSQYNRARWKNAEYDQLLAQSSRMVDPAERIETLNAAERLLMEEMPIIPLFWKSKDYLVSQRVENWPASLIDLRSYKHVRLER